MMRPALTPLYVALLLTLLFIVPGLQARVNNPDIDSSVTFFYYQDLQKAENFYAEIIGLRKVLDEGWVKMFSIPGGGIVGLVDEEHSTPGLSAHKPVMLSIVTEDISDWYARISEKGPEYIIKELELGEDVGILINAFLMKDPGGYHVEFFKWKQGKGPETGNHSFHDFWDASGTTEKMYFTLGMMNSYAESVANKAKVLGLGEPRTAEETDKLWPYAEMIAKKNGVEIYREDDFLVTDLFPGAITRDKHVIFIYIDDTLDKYLKIKADKNKLLKAGKYRGEARKNIARRFGRLLSYKADVIEDKLSKKLNQDQ